MGALRLLLAISVLLQHIRGCGYAMTGGAASVQTFFIISGFLIAMILDVKYNKPGQLWLFYSNRALRIYSTYWVVLVAAGLVQAATHFALHHSIVELVRANAPRLGFAGAGYLVLTNLLIIGQDMALFMQLGQHGLMWSASFWKSSPIVPEFMLIPPAWSLSLELAFYAIAPWLLRRRTRWIVAVMAGSVAVRAALSLSGLGGDPWSYRFFPNEVSLFLAGALAYRLIYRNPRMQSLSLKMKLLTVGVFPAVVLFPLYDRSRGEFFSATKLLYLGYAVVAMPLLFRMTSGIPLDRWLGDLSYPFYLCHFSIAQILNHFATRFSVLSRASLAIVLSCGLAALCVIALDKPLDRFRQARLKRTAARGAGTAVVAHSVAIAESATQIPETQATEETSALAVPAASNQQA